MTEYGQAFYGSDEIHASLGRQLGEWKVEGSKNWLCGDTVAFRNPTSLYRLCKNHWFYNSDEFRRAKKPTCNDHLQVPRPLADYSDDELQAEIDRRKAQDDEITILARQTCADNKGVHHLQIDFIAGKRDNTPVMRIAKAAIIAGMELQKGRET